MYIYIICWIGFTVYARNKWCFFVVAEMQFWNLSEARRGMANLFNIEEEEKTLI